MSAVLQSGNRQDNSPMTFIRAQTPSEHSASPCPWTVSVQLKHFFLAPQQHLPPHYQQPTTTYYKPKSNTYSAVWQSNLTVWFPTTTKLSGTKLSGNKIIQLPQNYLAPPKLSSNEYLGTKLSSNEYLGTKLSGTKLSGSVPPNYLVTRSKIISYHTVPPKLSGNQIKNYLVPHKLSGSI